jgi:hypothetical protein
VKKILVIVLIGILLTCICLSGCVDQEKKAQEEARVAAEKAKALEDQRLAQEAATRAKALEEQRKAEEIAVKAREQAAIKAVSSVVSGKGVPEASPYIKSKGMHPIIIIDTSGIVHAWNDEVPKEWRPKSINETQLVAVVTKGTKSLQVCDYWTGPDVTRYQYYVKIDLREAKTGNIVKTNTLYGSTPIQCRQSEIYSLTSLYGTQVEFSQVKSWLQDYVVS